jgi:hypothetical protein
MTSKKLIPFSWLPGSWGLKGEAFDRAKIEYELEGLERKVALSHLGLETDEDRAVAEAAVLLKAEEITSSEHDKMVAAALKKPWVEVKKMEVNPEDVKQGYMELDWNDEFVAMLHAQGYTGDSDESTVNKWFNDICRTVLLQENADMDFGLQDTETDVIKVRNKPKTDGIDD